MESPIKAFFLGIRELLYKNRPDLQEDPYDLGEGGRKRLRQLQKYNEWSTFADLLDTHTRFVGEKLLNAESTEEHNFYRGKIVGLRESVLLVDKIIAEEDLNEDLKRRHERDRERERDARSAALFGTGIRRDGR